MVVYAGWWSNSRNVASFMKQLGDKLGYRKLEDWYQITQNDFKKHGGITLLNIYQKSPPSIVMNLVGKNEEAESTNNYNNNNNNSVNNNNINSTNINLTTNHLPHEWHAWKFKTIPKKWWDNIENQKSFMRYLGEQLNYTQMTDWYQISHSAFVEHRGLGLIYKKYNHSPAQVVMAVYNDHIWHPWRFYRVPFTLDVGNQFLDHLGGILGYTKMEDWYNISIKHFHENNGSFLFHHFKGPAAIVMAIYNSHNWMPWKFKFSPHHVFQNNDVLVKFFSHVEKELQIQNLVEWYRISYEVLGLFGPVTYFKKEGMFSVLQTVYPHHSWNKLQFVQSQSKVATQRWVTTAIRKYLKNIEVHENYFHPSLVFEDSGKPITMDVFVPSLKLALEYNGKQHYQTKAKDAKLVEIFGDRSATFLNDEYKSELLHKTGITLVTIPPTWDRKFETLKRLIIQKRRDIVFHDND